jgi:hypothetical protein
MGSKSTCCSGEIVIRTYPETAGTSPRTQQPKFCIMSKEKYGYMASSEEKEDTKRDEDEAGDSYC